MTRASLLNRNKKLEPRQRKMDRDLEILWVKLRNGNAATQVSIKGCEYVDDFLEAYKKKLSPLLDSFSPAHLSLSTTADGPALRPGLRLVDIPSQPGYLDNDHEHPLFISVADGFPVTQPSAPTGWRAVGVITGARKMGFRRGLYRPAQDYLGFYEKRNGTRQSPFTYREDGALMINVLFEQKSDALHFRAFVYETVDSVSPSAYLTVSLSVEPAFDAVLDDTILVGHFKPDNDSPQETPRSVSGVSELYNTSPVFRYQRLEDQRFFGSIYLADRAHIIDKAVCEKDERFSKFRDNENNCLALGKDVHCWFDGLTNVDLPLFKLLIKHVASNKDPDNDDRYRVLLTVEAYNVEAAELLFPRLKAGSTVLDDTHAETFIYVLDPDEFHVCLSWKNDKIDSLWNLTPVVD